MLLTKEFIDFSAKDGQDSKVKQFVEIYIFIYWIIEQY